MENCELDQTDNWLVVNTQPHKETYALVNLRRQGFACYCPMVVKRIRHARRAYDANRPMFPSYIFVNYASTEGKWRRVQSTFGVRSIVLQGEMPGLIADHFIDGDFLFHPSCRRQFETRRCLGNKVLSSQTLILENLLAH